MMVCEGPSGLLGIAVVLEDLRSCLVTGVEEPRLTGGQPSPLLVDGEDLVGRNGPADGAGMREPVG
jgi:hypothetical protein